MRACKRAWWLLISVLKEAWLSLEADIVLILNMSVLLKGEEC